MSAFGERIEWLRESVFHVLSPHRGKCECSIQRLSKYFDWFIALLILFSSFSAFVWTFSNSHLQYVLSRIDDVILWIFTAEYLLRLWTADLNYKAEDEDKERRNRKFKRLRRTWKYIWSPLAIIDLVAILPFWIPVPIVKQQKLFLVLRIFRVARLLRYAKRYEIVIDNMWAALRSQRKELRVSLMVIGALMMVASVLMFVAEEGATLVGNEKGFANAFDGLWWAVSTITTVGYGDFYPKTVLGRLCGVVIALAGVAAIAVPTAIINSGFVKGSLKKSEFKKILSQHDAEQDMQLSKQREMIDALARRFAEFEGLQQKTDQKQDVALAEQRRLSGELTQQLAGFINSQHDNDKRQDDLLAAQTTCVEKLTADTKDLRADVERFMTAVVDRFVGVEKLQQDAVHNQNNLLAKQQNTIDELKNRFDRLEELQKNKDGITGAQLAQSMDGFMKKTNERLDGLQWALRESCANDIKDFYADIERRFVNFGTELEKQQRMMERYFAPEEKPDGIFTKAIKHLPFWNRKSS